MRSLARWRGLAGCAGKIGLSFALVIGSVGFSPGVGAAATFELLDVNQNSAPPLFASRVSALGESVLFSARADDTGRELYSFDGSPDRTRRLTDGPGAIGSRPSTRRFVLGDIAYFAASEPLHGRELWRTDGSAQGTWRVADIVPGEAGSDPRYFAVVGDVLYFVAWSPDAGEELWLSDGTEAGTRLVADIRPGALDSRIESITALGNLAVFLANDGTHGPEPWVSDGTAAGTRLLRDIRPGEEGSNRGWFWGGCPTRMHPLKAWGGEVYFPAYDGVHGQELWKTDGTESGTVLVADLEPGAGSSFVVPKFSYRDALILVPNGGTSSVAYATDGTQEGTRPFPDDVPLVGDAIVFRDEIWTVRRGQDSAALWATDGTSEGSRLVATIDETDEGYASLSPYFGEFRVVGDRLFWLSWQFGGGSRKMRLWSLGGADADSAANPLGPVFNRIKSVTVWGDEVVFLAAPWVPSWRGPMELWRSDGTEAGTQPLGDLRADNRSSLQSDDLMAWGDRVYFFADASDDNTGAQRRLYRSDGTLAGTEPVPAFEFVGAPRIPLDAAAPLVAAKEFFYVRTRTDIWRSDGTYRGLKQVLYLDDAAHPTSMVVLDEALVFDFQGDLWRGDGEETINLTGGLADPAQPSGGFGNEAAGAGGKRFADVLGVAAGRVFFLWNDPESGRELWSTDGTVAGTALLHEARPGSESGFPSDGNHIGVEAGSLLYFVLDDGLPGYELWRTDGTAVGTILVRAFPADDHGNLDAMAGTPSGRLYLVHRKAGAASADELWVSDGTPASTRRVRELPGRSCGKDVVAVGEAGLFWVCEEVAGAATETAHRLWRTDGTESGTRALPGTAGRGPGPALRAVGHRAYFQTRSPNELWVSDGTSGGTRALGGLGGDQAAFSTESVTALGPRLFLTGDDGTHGYEPFTLLPDRHFPASRGVVSEGSVIRRAERTSPVASGD